MSRIMALDYGKRRVGVAVSDPGGVIAQPHSVIDAADLEDRLPPLVRELDVKRIVLGLPISLSGAEGPAAREVRRFAERVEELTGLPVVLVDERLTTVTAERALVAGGMRRRRRRQVVDKVAAAVLLQSYLEGR